MFSIISLIIGFFTSSSAVESVAGAVAEPLFNFPKMALRIGAILLVVGGIGGTWWYIHHLKAELVTVTASVTTLTNANVEQSKALQLCSDNTNKLKSDADAWAVRAKKAEDAAMIKAQPHFAKATEIMKRKPKVGQSDCDAANDLLNSLIPVRGK